MLWTCTAAEFRFPRWRWYKCQEELAGERNSRIEQIRLVVSSNSGVSRTASRGLFSGNHAHFHSFFFLYLLRTLHSIIRYLFDKFLTIAITYSWAKLQNHFWITSGKSCVSDPDQELEAHHMEAESKKSHRTPQKRGGFARGSTSNGLHLVE